MQKEKVLFDTDIGNDIDDALALAYLLCEPRCDLVGITTVSEQPELRAKMVSAICTHADRRDVPIHVGCPGALLIDMPQKSPGQARALTGWACDEFAPANTAIEFMYRTILDNPGEINLLAVGPMTNIATLFTTHPDAAPLLKSLVLMCGAFTRNQGEWNAFNDPHATAVTYGNGMQPKPPRHYSCGLDVTLRCQMDRDACRAEFAKYKILDPVRDFAEVWFEHAPVATFHDPLAAACLFEPDLCEWDDAFVKVSLTDPTLGWTVPHYGASEKPHKIARAVDAPRFFDRYFSTLR